MLNKIDYEFYIKTLISKSFLEIEIIRHNIIYIYNQTNLINFLRLNTPE